MALPQAQETLAVAGSAGTLLVLVFWLLRIFTLPAIRRHVSPDVPDVLGAFRPGTINSFVLTGLLLVFLVLLVGLLVVQLLRLFLLLQLV